MSEEMIERAREIAGPHTTCKGSILAGEHDDWAEVRCALKGLQMGVAALNEQIEDYCRAVLADNSPRHDEPFATIGKAIRAASVRATRAAYNPNERLREALTPSAETKAAYIGEFNFSIEEGEYGSRIIPVPWTTIKEIMAAIRERALSPLPQGEDT